MIIFQALVTLIVGYVLIKYSVVGVLPAPPNTRLPIDIIGILNWCDFITPTLYRKFLIVVTNENWMLNFQNNIFLIIFTATKVIIYL